METIIKTATFFATVAIILVLMHLSGANFN